MGFRGAAAAAAGTAAGWTLDEIEGLRLINAWVAVAVSAERDQLS